MTRFSLDRLRRLEPAEVIWRARGALDIAQGRLRTALHPPRWNRGLLAARLAPDPALQHADHALAAGDWNRAQAALAQHFTNRPPRFVIAPAFREPLVREIGVRFPDAKDHARARAERMLAGRYDLLGYENLPFDGRSWHADPVHGRTAPREFWSQVPYLDPACGDHKIIWEFNRHQHWLELGRAFWLTGDERYRTECLRQLESWLEANPPLMGVNWASMLELAFRTVSWIWALHFFVAEEDRGSAWLVDLLLGIDLQLDHVERHLSYYFSPNTHLLGEALALYIAGRTLPELKASARREATGRRVLLEELSRQIADDGGHCERSTHYHRYTLDFYLLALAVARITSDPAAGPFEHACVRLAAAARALADDAGRLPHWGDDDGGSLLPITRRATDDITDSLAVAAALTGRQEYLVAAPPEETWWMLGHDCFAEALDRVTRLPRAAQHASAALPVTGYYVARHGGDHLVVDAGPHGYLNAGHAHADALAITFTRRGRPLLIDTGTACYTTDAPTRDRFRSTAFHNTLTLDGRPQSLPRGPFHWSRMANAAASRWRSNRRFDYFAGTHNGYLPLAHYRHVLALHGDALIVADCVCPAAGGMNREAHGVEGHGDAAQVRADVHWHLDPSWTATLCERYARLQGDAESIDLHVAGGTLERFRGDEDQGLGWYSPAYGRIEPTATLRLSANAPAPLWLVSVFGLDPSNRVQHVSIGPVESPAGAVHHAAAVHLRRDRSDDVFVVAEPLAGARQAPWRAAEVECDASMLFARAVDGAITEVALTDVTTVRSERLARFVEMYPSRVGDVYLVLEEGQRRWSPEIRKDTECAGSLDSLTAPR